MTDAEDFVYIDAPVPRRGLRERRRQLTLTDADWEPAGDATAVGGRDGRLHAEICVNKVVMVLELVPEDLLPEVPDLVSAASELRSRPRLRVRGHKHVVVGLFAV